MYSFLIKNCQNYDMIEMSKIGIAIKKRKKQLRKMIILFSMLLLIESYRIYISTYYISNYIRVGYIRDNLATNNSLQFQYKQRE